MLSIVSRCSSISSAPAFRRLGLAAVARSGFRHRTILPSSLVQSTNSVRSLATTNKSNNKSKNPGTLRVVGPDKHGILAACTKVLNQHGCNIVQHEQCTLQDMFFSRLSFHYGKDCDKADCEAELQELLLVNDDDNKSENTLQALWDWKDRRKKLGILVSKYDHCLWELLLRHQARELDADIEVVISNHETLRPLAETFGIPYHVTPVETKFHPNSTELPPHEQDQLELLQQVDVIVLARYMQILSPQFLDSFGQDQIINIHHSFLPAFSGGRPYHQAHERGVKLIGATAHYTTQVLDDGPIIEQDVVRVSHRDSISQLMKKGRVLERNVLLRALEAHLDDRVIVHKNRCVVFGD